MPRWLKHFAFVLLLVVFSGCAGSCSGCSGCGITPLPGGFPPENRIENSSSVRITKSGLDFIAQNVGALAPALLGGSGTVNAGVVTFQIPPSDSDIKDPVFGFKVGTVHICPDGPKPDANPPECTVEADLSKAKLTIATDVPHNIVVGGTLAVRLQKLHINGSGVAAIANADVVLDKGGQCSPKEYADIPVDVNISIEADTDAAHGFRKGYSRVKINKIDIDQGQIENSITFCGGFNATILNLVKPLVIGQVMGGLTGTLKDTVEKQLCAKQDATTGASCPTGSFPDAGDTCRYCTPDGGGKCPDSAECVGIALGTDGNINLSAALSALSPGTKGGFDFVAALGGEGARDDGSGFLWGDLNPVAGGATVGLLGGAEPTPITQCVPIANLEKPSGIPIPDELQDPAKLLDVNTPANWTGPGPHFGFALSERYLNYALGAVYNSGALCLGVGSGTLGSLLNSDTLGLLIPSFKDLARQKQIAPLALVIRPQTPPTVVVGKGTDIATDPTLKVTLNKLSIDFYVWSSDRFIRAFTATFDVVAPVNLDVTAEGIAPMIDKVTVANPSITNSLLREDEKKAATSLAGIISSQIGSALGGAIAPINLNNQVASFGLSLNIPPTVQGQGSPGITKLEKGSDRYLGLFAGFALATAPTGGNDFQGPIESDTSAKVSEKRVVLDGLVLPTLTEENAPEVELAVSSALDDGAHKLEWQYRLNGGLWRPWTYSRYIKIRDPELSIQMRHKIEVRSRVVGAPATMDKTPALVEVLIDKTPPEITFARRVHDGKMDVDVSDLVSTPDKLAVRWSLDDGAFTDWVVGAALAPVEVGNASQIVVESRDEEGNVAQKSHALIRGKEDAALASGSGCGCEVVGGSSPGGRNYGIFAALGLGALWFVRRRNARLRPIATFLTMTVAASWSGCSCGTDDDSSNKGSGGTGALPSTCAGKPTCEALTPGLVGAYASAAVTSDGKIWVAGYDDMGYGKSEENGENQYLWGDLVVGKWNGKTVDWQSVDGLPTVDPKLEPGSAGGPPDPEYNDTNGFRSGLVDPGDDVGLWTSIALVKDQPMVAYFDAKNRALKFARYDGKAWAIHTVQSKTNGDVGRYAKLLVVGGKPLIAFLYIEPQGSDGAKSGVRIAAASKEIPAAAADWTFSDVYTDTATPCRAFVCKTGECRVDTGKCQAAGSGCDPKCAADEKCFVDNGAPACVKIYSKTNPEAYPEAAGLYIAVQPTKSGLGMVFYDRIHGNLMASSQASGKWSTPTIVAGQGTGPNGPIDTGDVGIGASLAIDSAGDWHVAYANGFDETVTYMKLAGGTTPGTPEVADPGVSQAGQVIVGDDTSISVGSSGEVTIAYQDSTRGKARLATGKVNGATHTWTQKDLAVTDFAGAFSQILNVSGKTQVLTWWRRAKPKTEGDVVLVAP